MSSDVVDTLPPSVCILVENLPAPYDRRVWQEARALTENGYHVSIICPKGSRFERKLRKDRRNLHLSLSNVGGFQFVAVLLGIFLGHRGSVLSCAQGLSTHPLPCAAGLQPTGRAFSYRCILQASSESGLSSIIMTSAQNFLKRSSVNEESFIGLSVSLSD